jgi:hypothetical protein
LDKVKPLDLLHSVGPERFQKTKPMQNFLTIWLNGLGSL